MSSIPTRYWCESFFNRRAAVPYGIWGIWRSAIARQFFQTLLQRNIGETVIIRGTSKRSASIAIVPR